VPNHMLQLDRLLRSSLTAFAADATAERRQGKRLPYGLKLRAKDHTP
jgi:hypothetical protein